MKRAFLERLDRGESGTFGRLYFGDGWAFSGELDWRDNRPNISCIPVGTYKVLWTYSPAFKRMMYLVASVPGRSGIRIHAANYMGHKDKGLKCHLYGCIALGTKIGTIAGQRALIRSRPAVGRLERWSNRQPFELEIFDGIR